ncbi:unnamed protein product [Blepharisma stoltei]|uniref:Mitochondrial carrier protein n=1 Tax=Blepharisma stoltei TaxID=1481888 RepID=A0AAU9J8T6_9CILI|nr:unnamed protein product [Blepharisma stoltei]
MVNESWRAGAFAGVTTALTLQPLDVIKTHLIVSQHKSHAIIQGVKLVLAKYGMKGFWRGSTPAVGRALMGSGSYFFLLEEFKRLLGDSFTVANGMSSGFAKASITTLCLPMTLIKVRMEAPNCQEYKGIWHAAKRIYSEEGVRGFYQGLTPALIRDVPYSFVGYEFYELYIKYFSQLTELDRTYKAITLAAGVAAGLSATILTHPFDVIKTRIQFGKFAENQKYHYTGVILGIKEIYYDEGMTGFLRGIMPRIMKRIFSFPLVWTLYEQIKLTY